MKFAIDAGGMDNITAVLVPFPAGLVPGGTAAPENGSRPASTDVSTRRDSVTPESGFTIDVDENEYLPEGGREASAIVTVALNREASGPGRAVKGGTAVARPGMAGKPVAHMTEK